MTVRHSLLVFSCVAVLVLVPFAPAGGPDASLKPTFGGVSLRAGFAPDPHVVRLSAGGPVKTNLGGVNAHVGRAPDYSLTYTSGSYPLIFQAESSADTTLLINTPDGRWLANDDSEGRNPKVRIASPRSGRYDIWVGTFNAGTASATLKITERDGGAPGVPPPGPKPLIDPRPPVGPTPGALVTQPAHFTDKGERVYVIEFGPPGAVAKIRGQGTSDVDLFIQSMSGVSVTSGTGGSDTENCSWVPSEKRQYRVIVRNLDARANMVQLQHNGRLISASSSTPPVTPDVPLAGAPKHFTRWLGRTRIVGNFPLHEIGHHDQLLPIEWLSKSKGIGSPDYFIYIAAAYKGKLAVADASRAFDEAVQYALKGNRPDHSKPAPKGFGALLGVNTQVPASEELYVFGYYNITKKKGSWVAIYPGLREGASGKRGSQRLHPNGSVVNHSTWTTMEWRDYYTSYMGLALHYADDDRGGMAFSFDPPRDPYKSTESK